MGKIKSYWTDKEEMSPTDYEIVDYMRREKAHRFYDADEVDAKISKLHERLYALQCADEIKLTTGQMGCPWTPEGCAVMDCVEREIKTCLGIDIGTPAESSKHTGIRKSLRPLPESHSGGGILTTQDNGKCSEDAKGKKRVIGGETKNGKLLYRIVKEE